MNCINCDCELINNDLCVKCSLLYDGIGNKKILYPKDIGEVYFLSIETAKRIYESQSWLDSIIDPDLYSCCYFVDNTLTYYHKSNQSINNPDFEQDTDDITTIFKEVFVLNQKLDNLAAFK